MIFPYLKCPSNAAYHCKGQSALAVNEQTEDSRGPIVLVGEQYQHIVDRILSYLDGDSLLCAEKVCIYWYSRIFNTKAWKHLVRYRFRHDYLWKGIMEIRQLDCDWVQKELSQYDHPYFRKKYADEFQNMEEERKMLKSNWLNGNCAKTKVACNSPVNCLQYDDAKVVTGHLDATIKIWSCSH